MLLPKQVAPADRFSVRRDPPRWLADSLSPQDCPGAGLICAAEIAAYGIGCGFQCVTTGAGLWYPGQTAKGGCDYHDSRCPGSGFNAHLMAH
jgi:hypothetical protein